MGKGNITFNNLYEGTKKAVNKAVDTTKKTVNQGVNKVKDISHTVTDVSNKLIHGTTELPPNFKRMLEKYGDKRIVRMSAVRQPLQQALEMALDVTSQGKLGKESLKNEDIDRLYHLKLEIGLEGVDHPLALEKEAVVTLTYDPKHGKGFEVMPINKDFHDLTLNDLISNAQRAMGSAFIKYSSKDNNCQRFVDEILTASNLNDSEIKKFVVQDLKHLFSNTYRKLTNTITDIGAKAEIIKQGGAIGGTLQSILFDKHKFSKDEAQEWMKRNDKPMHKIDVTDKHIRFRQAPPKRGAKYYMKHIDDGVEFIFFEDAKDAPSGGMIKHVHHHHHHYHGEAMMPTAIAVLPPPPPLVEGSGVKAIKKKQIISLLNHPFEKRIVDLRMQGKNPPQPRARTPYCDPSVPDPFNDTSSSDGDSSSDSESDDDKPRGKGLKKYVKPIGKMPPPPKVSIKF
jgi:hypothetical protein